MKYTRLSIRIPATLLTAAFQKIRQGDLSLSQVINNYLEVYAASKPDKP